MMRLLPQFEREVIASVLIGFGHWFCDMNNGLAKVADGCKWLATKCVNGATKVLGEDATKEYKVTIKD